MRALTSLDVYPSMEAVTIRITKLVAIASPALKSDTYSCHSDDHFVSLGVCFFYFHIGRSVIYTKPNLKRKRKRSRLPSAIYFILCRNVAIQIGISFDVELEILPW